MSVILSCENCDREATITQEDYDKYKKPITCKDCKAEMVLVEDEESEEEEEEFEDDTDTIICPYCEENIKKFKRNLLETVDGKHEEYFASCSKCNSSLGIYSQQ